MTRNVGVGGVELDGRMWVSSPHSLLMLKVMMISLLLFQRNVYCLNSFVIFVVDKSIPDVFGGKLHYLICLSMRINEALQQFC